MTDYIYIEKLIPFYIIKNEYPDALTRVDNILSNIAVSRGDLNLSMFTVLCINKNIDDVKMIVYEKNFSSINILSGTAFDAECLDVAKNFPFYKIEGAISFVGTKHKYDYIVMKKARIFIGFNDEKKTNPYMVFKMPFVLEDLEKAVTRIVSEKNEFGKNIVAGIYYNETEFENGSTLCTDIISEEFTIEDFVIQLVSKTLFLFSNNWFADFEMFNRVPEFRATVCSASTAKIRKFFSVCAQNIYRNLNFDDKYIKQWVNNKRDKCFALEFIDEEETMLSFEDCDGYLKFEIKEKNMGFAEILKYDYKKMCFRRGDKL